MLGIDQVSTLLTSLSAMGAEEACLFLEKKKGVDWLEEGIP